MFVKRWLNNGGILVGILLNAGWEYNSVRSFANLLRKYNWNTCKCPVKPTIEYNCVRSRKTTTADELISVYIEVKVNFNIEFDLREKET